MFDDVAFLKDPDNWPNWPVCPVKCYIDEELICGLLFAGTITVYKLNMFSGWTKEEFEKAKKWKYETIEDMINDGWRVD